MTKISKFIKIERIKTTKMIDYRKNIFTNIKTYIIMTKLYKKVVILQKFFRGGKQKNGK